MKQQSQTKHAARCVRPDTYVVLHRSRSHVVHVCAVIAEVQCKSSGMAALHALIAYTHFENNTMHNALQLGSRQILQLGEQGNAADVFCIDLHLCSSANSCTASQVQLLHSLFVCIPEPLKLGSLQLCHCAQPCTVRRSKQQSGLLFQQLCIAC